MPFGYYVKSGGTCVNDDGRVDMSSQRTGTWTATANQYYESIHDVFVGDAPTTAPADGDFIICSHLHDKDHAADGKGGPDIGNVFVISVDNANQENYLAGAKEGTTSGIYYCVVGSSSKFIHFYGMSFYGNTRLELVAGAGENSAAFTECVLDGNTDPSGLVLNTDGSYILLDACTITFTNVNGSISLRSGNILEVRGGSNSFAQSNLIEVNGNGGGTVLIENFDASVIATSGQLIDISASSDDNCVAEVTRCKLPTSGVICNSTAVLPGLNVIGESLKVGTGAGWHQINEVMGAGTNSLETGIYRFSGSKYNLAGNYSVDMTTNSSASFHRFLRHRIEQFYIDTNDFTTTVNFLIHFARDGSATEYNDDEFWIDVDFNDGADDGLGSSVTTKPAVLATGTAPTTEALLWVGLGTNAQMSVNVSATIGASAGNIQSGTVTVWANFAVASDTVFVDKRVVLS